ncbi:MAG TPA: zinc ribbon domain-containing protein [Thermoplasmata archaeon]|nr:zinc ribbon domain-containing protein [Thermoplasmata archaeon]
MSRRLVAGSLVQPAWEAHGVRVEGPDEDAFTLAVDAIERLGLAPADLAGLERIDLVGDFAHDVDWAIPEAVGTEGAEVARHHGGLSSLFQALSGASLFRPDSSQSSLVVAVDVAATAAAPSVPQAAAAAVAFQFADAPGAQVIGYTSRNHPPERRPDASAWVRQSHKAAPDVATADRGLLGVIAEAPPPVLLNEWKSAFPSIPPVVRPWELSEWGSLPTVRGAIAIHEHVAAAGPNEAVFVAAIRRERTDFLALRAGAAVRWVGEWSDRGRSAPAPNDQPFAPSVETHAVSEGAYVPRPRYVENLPSRWRFVSERCDACGRTTFPIRGYCRYCRETGRLRRVELPKADVEVEAVTTVAPGAQPTEFDFQVSATGSYSVALVRLAAGVRATLQISGPATESVRVGDRLDTRLRRLYPMEGAWRYGRKAVVPGARAGGIPSTSSG